MMSDKSDQLSIKLIILVFLSRTIRNGASRESRDSEFLRIRALQVSRLFLSLDLYTCLHTSMRLAFLLGCAARNLMRRGPSEERGSKSRVVFNGSSIGLGSAVDSPALLSIN